jgi:hypothetical protein
VVQGEILEGLVARIVSHQSSDEMKEVLRSLSETPFHGGKPENYVPLFFE